MSRNVTCYDRYYASKNREADNGRPVVEMLYHFWLCEFPDGVDGWINIAVRDNIGNHRDISPETFSKEERKGLRFICKDFRAYIKNHKCFEKVQKTIRKQAFSDKKTIWTSYTQADSDPFDSQIDSCPHAIDAYYNQQWDLNFNLGFGFSPTGFTKAVNLFWKDYLKWIYNMQHSDGDREKYGHYSQHWNNAAITHFYQKYDSTVCLAATNIPIVQRLRDHGLDEWYQSPKNYSPAKIGNQVRDEARKLMLEILKDESHSLHKYIKEGLHLFELRNWVQERLIWQAMRKMISRRKFYV